MSSLIEKLKEKITPQNNDETTISQYNISKRLKRIEDWINRTDPNIVQNISDIQTIFDGLNNKIIPEIKIARDESITASNISKHISTNLRDAANILKTDTNEMITAGEELRATIKNEVSRIALAFEVFGTDMKNGTKSAIGGIQSVYYSFKWLVDNLPYPISEVVKYAKRCSTDGLFNIPTNVYNAFWWAFIYEHGVFGQTSYGYDYLKNSSQELGNGFSIMGDTFKNAPANLAAVIQDASKNIENAISNFLSKFGGLSNNLAHNLNKQ